MKVISCVIPDVDPIRPTVPVTALYEQAFLETCIKVDDVVDVKPSDVYDAEAKTFSDMVYPEGNIVPSTTPADDLK